MDFNAKLDFAGQALAFRLLHVLLAASGVVAFFVGLALQSLSITMYTLALGTVVTALV
ncbi:hypothetical protein PhCBS80983_g01721 [Powellomyces hirtus]|uniref:Uncharacterized protein n=1 Tax=Powellomyces hirtus TaxID=109895 RepID=A0A507E9S1_9FUNG|nr:hypothetical protein DFJ77DRAFT_505701 [Powellomyces hirtus]TPX60546.1 hypothetical protein PhCBS80983_g01721 [Powellomyces hirtus]